MDTQELLDKLNEIHSQMEELADDSYMIDSEIDMLSKQMNFLHDKKMRLLNRYEQKRYQLEKVLEELEKIDKE